VLGKQKFKLGNMDLVILCFFLTKDLKGKYPLPESDGEKL
jgi:hypothetical protein